MADTAAPVIHHSMDDETDVPPRETIYIQNLNEKIRIPELKRQLYALFSQFGPILDIVAARSLKMRGQAFIVFKDITTATTAIKKMNGVEFHDKPMHVTYAKSKSDAIAQLEGEDSFREHKRKREEEKKQRLSQPVAKKPKTEKRPKQPKPRATVSAASGPAEPNKILFIENLPEKIEEQPDILNILFSNYEGFKEVRLVPSKKGIAFVEYDTEVQAGNAMVKLQGFKVSGHAMKISFAKK